MFHECALSRLNKRFYALVYRSISDLSSRPFNNAPLSRLSSLTRLRLEYSGVVSLPTTLRSLQIISNSPRTSCTLLRPLPQLIVSLDLHLFGAHDGIEELLRELASSLRQLYLFPDTTSGPSRSLAAYLAAEEAYFPKLTSLSITFSLGSADALFSFYARHAHQIEALGFMHCPRPVEADSLVQHDLPKLKSLSGTLSTAMLAELLRLRCPTITTLNFATLEPLYIPETHLSILRALSIESIDDFQLLSKFTNLRSIRDLRLTNDDTHEMVSRKLVYLVRSCDLLETPDLQFLAQATQLTKLSLQFDLLSTELPAEILLHLPSLTDLTLTYKNKASTLRATQAVRYFLGSSPRLSKISTFFCPITIDEEKLAVSKLILDLEKRGSVHSFDMIMAEEDSAVPVRAQLQALILNWVRVKVYVYDPSN